MLILDPEEIVDITIAIVAIVVAVFLAWLYRVSKGDKLNFAALVGLVTSIIFAVGKIIDVFGPFSSIYLNKLFANFLELILILGLAISFGSYYIQWRRED
jgi:hypothetical protein